MIDRKHIEKEIDVQEKIVSGLKKEIFGSDKSSSSSYIREFQSEFAGYRKIVGTDEIISRALASDIVYFGDYHPLDDSQEWVLFLVREMKKKGADVVLALEMLYEYQQESLDRWMKGKYSEKEFLRVINYDSEWGFDWESYRRIFEMAKEPFVPLFGIDYEPRDQLRFIKRRDRMMARKILSIRQFFPGHTVVVMAGESHLASSHLPDELRKISEGKLRELVIVQNIDDIYWDLLREGREEATAVMVARNRYCVFTASPLVKYQSYRDIIEKWSDQPVSEAVSGSLKEMVDNISAILLGKGEALEVEISRDWVEPVESVFPEIHFRKTYKSFSTLLRSKKVSLGGLLAVKQDLRRTGLSYFPALNIFLMLHFNRMSAAVEASRFVVYAMRGELGMSGRIRRSIEDRFYAFVIEEALAWAGARIINPRIGAASADDLLGRIDEAGEVSRPLDGFSIGQTRDIAAMLKYHFKWEREWKKGSRVTCKLGEIHRLEIRKRLFIIKTLGRTLGDAIHKGYREGKIRRRELLRLFRDNFSHKGSGIKTYMRWVEKTSPQRDFRSGGKEAG
ncbi:MAG: ChaN family lipoprotein [Candidatus Krumholzibacteriota bacterium]|nr:ChaN family lipoprotein [Candidatus Krumholzibacteriota bacterium]